MCTVARKSVRKLLSTFETSYPVDYFCASQISLCCIERQCKKTKKVCVTYYENGGQLKKKVTSNSLRGKIETGQDKHSHTKVFKHILHDLQCR